MTTYDRYTQKLLIKAYKDPDLKGKEVVIVANKIQVLSTKNRQARAKLLTSLTKKYPKQVPVITLIPKDNTLILIF